MRISFVDTDPRLKTDPNYMSNMGSFSVVAHGFNKGLKEIGAYADPDVADFVGICDALNISFKYKDKKSFVLNVWDATNDIPKPLVIQALRDKNQIILGLSSQISNLWNNYGIYCPTVMPGCDTSFWHQTKPKNDKLTFIFSSFANIRSGLDLALEAMDKAFYNTNRSVKLIVKNTDSNPVLEEWINKHRSMSLEIQYIKGRVSFEEMRDLYSVSHYSLNVMRMSSWGLNIHEAAACGCIPFIGNFNPSNTISAGIVSFMVNPSSEIYIHDKANELQKKGLHNAYGNFEYIKDSPKFYDYNIYDYIKQINRAYDLYHGGEFNHFNPRTPVVKLWSWKNAAFNLVNELSKFE